MLSHSLSTTLLLGVSNSKFSKHKQAALIGLFGYLLQALQKQLKLKDEIIQKMKVQASGTPEDMLVLKKKESLANAAAKSSRERANQLEDVSPKCMICSLIFALYIKFI